MTKAIEQSVRFNASPQSYLRCNMDSKKHSAATGGAAPVNKPQAGREKFTAWNGQLSGQNLLIVKNRMIVQSWRGTHFLKPPTPIPF